MKKHLLLPILAMFFLAIGLSSCDDTPPPPPPFDPTYNDYYLVGQWDLVQINGKPVTGFSQNFFDFYSDGSGWFYYWDNGTQYKELISWYCYDMSHSQVLVVNYQYGGSLECNYYFSNDGYYLYLTWYEYGRPMTYVYEFTGDLYSPRKTIKEGAKDSPVKSSAARPGLMTESKAVVKP